MCKLSLRIETYHQITSVLDNFAYSNICKMKYENKLESHPRERKKSVNEVKEKKKANWRKEK